MDLSTGTTAPTKDQLVSLREEGVDLSITLHILVSDPGQVSLREEGVDLSNIAKAVLAVAKRLPPRGGSGFKLLIIIAIANLKSLPPRGGSGFKQN